MEEVSEFPMLPTKGGEYVAERSSALKKAQQKYMERFSVARIRMEREKYEAVQEYAEGKGVSVNALVVNLLDQAMAVGSPQKAIQGPSESKVVPLPPDTLKAAQEAAEAAGEELPQFIDRAIEETADRDALPKEVIFGRAVDVVAEHYEVSHWDVLKELEGLADKGGEQGGH